jgi:hypothetical protein
MWARTGSRWLWLAEFSSIGAVDQATGLSPFEVNYGENLADPIDLMMNPKDATVHCLWRPLTKAKKHVEQAGQKLEEAQVLYAHEGGKKFCGAHPFKEECAGQSSNASCWLHLPGNPCSGS